MSDQTMNPEVLRVEALTVLRGGVRLLDNVGWLVRPGENWVILGANGSGKTSLLKVLAGYLAPTDGSIEVLGEKFGDCDWRELRERVGVVSSGVSQLMSDDDCVLDIVIGGKFGMMGIWGGFKASDRRKARELLAQVHADHLEKRPWYYLSQGERQRTLIARALMAEPRLLILDEPCSGLDPVAREDFLLFIESGRLRGLPLILVTHHVEEITPGFTHGLYLKDGRVVTAGSLQKTMKGQTLSTTFDHPLRVSRSAGRWRLRATS